MITVVRLCIAYLRRRRAEKQALQELESIRAGWAARQHVRAHVRVYEMANGQLAVEYPSDQTFDHVKAHMEALKRMN